MAGVGSQPVSTSALLSLLFLTNRKKKKSHKTLLSPWLDGSATSSGLQGDLLWTKEGTILLWMDSDRSEGWFDWNTENLYLNFLKFIIHGWTCCSLFFQVKKWLHGCYRDALHYKSVQLIQLRVAEILYAGMDWLATALQCFTSDVFPLVQATCAFLYREGW